MMIICTLLLISCNSEKDSKSNWNDKYVQLVKNGTLEFDQTLKVGDALDNYFLFKNKRWRELKTTQGRNIVQFEADIDVQASTEAWHFTNNPELDNSFKKWILEYGEELAVYSVIFVVNVDGNSFSFDYAKLEWSDGYENIINIEEKPDKFPILRDIYRYEDIISRKIMDYFSHNIYTAEYRKREKELNAFLERAPAIIISGKILSPGTLSGSIKSTDGDEFEYLSKSYVARQIFDICQVDDNCEIVAVVDGDKNILKVISVKKLP